jgi:hypothetical protein
VVLSSASIAATRSASRVIETFRLADEVIPLSYHGRLMVRWRLAYSADQVGNNIG